MIPVGYQIPISFQGRNLDSYMVRSVRAADLLLHKHPNIVVTIICVIISLSCVCVCVSLQDRTFLIGTELMKHSEQEVAKEEETSKFRFRGYKVSITRRKRGQPC